MKIGIIGAGAIGGLVGARLALAGEDVTFIARGAHLEAIGRQGMKLRHRDGREDVARGVKVAGSSAQAGVQDLLILAVKAHQLEAVADDVHHLMGPKTTIVTMQNGLPFWYFHEHGGALAGSRIHSVDQSGKIAQKIPAGQVIGCVVYAASALAAPGVVQHIEGDRFPMGELDGRISERVTRISEVFANAGLKAPVIEDIRSEVWLKLWGNLTFNPVSALTHATLADICQFPLTHELAASMMREAEEVAGKLGITFRVSIDKRIAGAEKVGKHKTSMLQDVAAGRAPEVDALVGSVVELGRLTHTPTPSIDAVYALVKLLAKTLAEEHGRLRVQPL
jgi:2-dehydropantoate 2-reductase